MNRATKPLLLSAFTFGAFVAFGCSGEDGGPVEDESEISAKTCGGIANLQCPTGYECEITASYPDASGKCVRQDAGTTKDGAAKDAAVVSDASKDASKDGAKEDAATKICGGFAGLKCADGYTCKLNGNYPDASGTCVKDDVDASVPKICGGFAGFKCPDGYICKGKGNHPDAAGTCVPDPNK